MLNKRIHLDFMTGLVLMILSVAVILESARMAKDVGGVFYSSPGMMPLVLALLLLFTGYLLFRRSMVTNGGLAGNLADIREWFREIKTSKSVREMLIGMFILALYTFLLAPRLPFALSTTIFMVFLLGYLNAVSLVKNIAITVCVVGAIHVIFRVIFHVPLP